MTESSSKSLGRKILKIAGIIFGCLLGLLVIVSILLLTLLEPYVERFLKNKVVESTEGVYTLDFDDMQLNLLDGSLVFENVLLQPDTAQHKQQKQQDEASPMLLQVQVPTIAITGIKFLNALLRREVDIGNVLVDKPQITLFYDTSVEKDTAKTKSGGNPLAGYINSLRIRNINMPDATFSHVPLAAPEKVQHLVQHLTFRVNDLLLDSLDQPDHTKMFEADDIRLQVRDYAYNSPDSVYHIQLGSLEYSSKQGEFLLQNTKIRSDNKANIALGPEAASPTLVDLDAPLLRITGFDIVEAYRTKQLRVEQVHLEHSALVVLQNSDIPSSQDTMSLADMYSTASEYLELFTLGELLVSNAQLALCQQFDTVATIHQLDKLAIAVQGIQLDSSTLFSPKENFFAEEFRFAAEDYFYQHPTSPYTIHASSMDLTTSENIIQARNIQIIGDWRKNEKLKQAGKATPVLYNISTPLLRISQTDLIQAYKTERLDIGSILVDKPHIDMLRDEELELVSFDKMLQESYAAVSGIVSQLHLGEFSIQDATLSKHTKKDKIKLTQRLEHASLVAKGLIIDSAFAYNPTRIPVQDAAVSVAGYTFQIPENPHTFKLGHIRYSTQKEELTAKTIEVQSDREQNNQLKAAGKAQRRLFDVQAKRLRISGLDIIKAYNTGQLEINQVVLNQPDLAILQDNDVAPPTAGQQKPPQNQPIFDILDLISVDNIRLEDGTFTYHDKRDEIVRTQVLEHAAASVTGLRLTPASMANLDGSLPLEEMTLTASDYTYRSPDSLYTLKLASLQYSSREQELIARSIDVVSDKEVHKRLKQEKTDKASRNLFDVSAEQFRITGLDLVRAYETGRFSMGEIQLTSPEVGIFQDHNVPTPESSNRSGKQQVAPERLQKMVNAFRVQNINIKDGTFKLNVLIDTLMRSQTVEHVSLDMQQFRLVDLAASDPLDMFYVDDIGLLIKDYSYYLPDSLYRFQVKEVRTSLNEQSVYIDSLRLIPLYKVEDFTNQLEYASDRFDIKVPSIRLSGIDLGALYNNQDIAVEKVRIKNVVAEVYRDNRVKQDPNRRPLTLQRMLRQVDFYIDIDTVLLDGSKLTYSEISPKGIAPGKVVMSNMLLEVLNITNDPDSMQVNNVASVNGSTLFMDESRLDVRFRFLLNHPEDLYTYEGTLDPMQFDEFNPLIENIMAVRAEKGRINKAAFSVTATEHIAEGQLDFLYEDLKIQLLDQEDKENPGLLRNVGSWLINNLVLKSDNPAGRRDMRKGTIDVDRNYQKSVFNHMSKAMMDGMTSSMMTPFVEKVVNIFISQ